MSEETPQERLVRLRRIRELRSTYGIGNAQRGDGSTGIPVIDTAIDDAREQMRLRNPTPALDRANSMQNNRETAAIAGNPATRWAVGLGDTLFGGPAQLGANIGGYAASKLPERVVGTDPYALANIIADTRKDWKELREDTQYSRSGQPANKDIAGVLGNMTAGGASMSGYELPYSLIKRAFQGGAHGAMLGAMAPVDSDNYLETKLAQTAVGTGLGFVIPPALGSIGDVLRGATGATGRYSGELLNKAAGSNRERIMSELRSAMTTNPFKLTPSQIASPSGGTATAPRGAANFSNLFRQAGSDNREGVAGFVADRMEKIMDSVKGIFKTGDVDQLVATRKANSEPLFNSARDSNSVVDVSPTLSLINQIIQENPNDTLLVRWLGQVRNNLTRSQTVSPAIQSTRIRGIGGNTPGSPGSSTRVPVTDVRSLDSLAGDMRRLLNEAAGDAPPDRRHFALVTRVKSQLQDDIGAANNDYRTALANFKRDSIPLNQARFGAEFNRQLERNGTEMGRYNLINDTLDDPNTILKNIDEIGIDFRSIDDIANPEQVGFLRSAKGAMERVVQDQNLGKGGNTAVDRMVGEIGGGTFINPLQRVMMVINQGLNRSGSAAQVKTMSDISKMGPEKILKLMEKFNPEDRFLVSQFLGYAPVVGSSNLADSASQAAPDIAGALRGN